MSNNLEKSFMTDEQLKKVEALAKYLTEDIENITQSKNDECEYYHGKDTYLVVNDNQAEELHLEAIENYIDELITPQIPINLQSYFNYTLFIKDELINSSRAQYLAVDEEEGYINGYYIYKQ